MPEEEGYASEMSTLMFNIKIVWLRDCPSFAKVIFIAHKCVIIIL